MRFGMFVDLQLPRPWTDTDEAELLAATIEHVVLGERAGISYAWCQEHHFLEEYSHSSAPEVLLGALSQVTSTMRLGHGITLMPPSFNHPARVAERIAMLDLLSGGRVEWGTGEAGSRIELEAFDVGMLDKRTMWAEAVHEAARMLAPQAYAGFEGRYFSMPARNVVPKPVQRPHPPLWVACSNRETLRMAARLGIGALTFAFMGGREARFWVEEYQEELERSCTPIGLAVNPNVAVLSGFMLHRDQDEAVRRGLHGLQFFAYGLSHYYRTGTHVPGATNVWQRFASADRVPLAGLGGIGSPAGVTEHFEELEEAGVDQVILLHQTGRTSPHHITEALELFGADVAPPFAARHAATQAAKDRRLAGALARARDAIVPPRTAEPVEVDAYPLLLERQGLGDVEVGTHRSVGAAALWRMNVGGGS